MESSHEANTKLYNSLGFFHNMFLYFTRDEHTVTLDVMIRKTKCNR